MSVLALFIALSGVAVGLPGKKSVDKNDIKRNAVRAKAIKRNAVTSAKIAGDAVTGGKIANGAVDTGQLANNAVTTGKIANSAVTTGKIANNAVTEQKIAPDAVTATRLAADSVRADELGPITRIQGAISINPGAAFADGATVNCPAGTQVISGGAQVATTDMVILTNTVTETNGWFASAVNNGGAAANLTIFAFCLQQ
ncbi:MAG: hypothetical protein ACRDKV_06350 [Solirubrobacterales bacterium]